MSFLEKLEVLLRASSPHESSLPFHDVAGRPYLVQAGIIAPEVSEGRSVKQFLLVGTYQKAFAALFVT